MHWLKELRISLICKYLDRYRNYPSCVLPYPHYKSCINIDRLADEENCVIVRRSDKFTDDTFNELGLIREGIILDKDLANMSMNLYGGKFTDEHLKYRCVGEATHPWEGEMIRVAKYKQTVNLLTRYSAIYFILKELHNKKFPYYRTDVKETRKLLVALKKTGVEEEGKIRVMGIANIVHTPNKLNYWHVELLLKSFSDELIKNVKSSWQISAAQFAYNDIIARNARKEPPSDIYQIPAECYM